MGFPHFFKCWKEMPPIFFALPVVGKRGEGLFLARHHELVSRHWT